MALFLNGKQLQCGNAIAAKPWTTLGTLTEGGLSLNVSGYTELLIYPKINGATYFDPIVIDVSEFNNASTIHFSIYQDNSHSYMGGLDYSDGSISFRRILISGWTSCDCVVKATCFSSGGSTTHHYSTDEQVVGTWIDGSTIYEKTLVMPNAVTVTANGAWIGSGVSRPSGSNVVRAEIVNDYIVGVIGIYISSTNELYLSNIPKTADITIPANTPITIRYTKSST